MLNNQRVNRFWLTTPWWHLGQQHRLDALNRLLTWTQETQPLPLFKGVLFLLRMDGNGKIRCVLVMKWIIPESSLRLAPESFSKDEIMVTEHIYKAIINTFNHDYIDLFFLSLSLWYTVIYRTTCFATPCCCQLEVVVSCWFQAYPTICVFIICYT